MPEPVAVIFDLDGVLADTTELHFQSWQTVAAAYGVSFERRTYERMRGLGRDESLAVFLENDGARFSTAQRAVIAEQKNSDYLERVSRMTPADLLPGARELLIELRSRGVRTAVASSSRNAEPVLARLGVRDIFDAVLDANTASRSKPDPEVFLRAASRLSVAPGRCVVIEDAAAGVAAARAAGMRVVGIGPAQRVGGADRVVAALRDVTIDILLELLA